MSILTINFIIIFIIFLILFRQQGLNPLLAGILLVDLAAHAVCLPQALDLLTVVGRVQVARGFGSAGDQASSGLLALVRRVAVRVCVGVLVQVVCDAVVCDF